MFFYFLFYISIFFLLTLKPKKSNIPVYIVFLMLLLLYGCRDYGGVDDIAYMNIYNDVISGKTVFFKDRSFIWISKILGFLGFNYKSVFMVYAAISFYYMYLTYNHVCNEKYDWLIGILGFITFCLIATVTVMRQFASAALLSYAFIMMYNKKCYKSIIYILLAIFIHKGAIIGFIALIITNMEIRKPFKIALPLMALIIGYTGSLRKLLQLMSFIVPAQYKNYIYLYEQTAPHIGLLHGILFLVYLLQILLDRKKFIETETDFLEKMQMLYFSTFFITLSDGWVSRVTIYFILFIPFIFKTFINCFSRGKDQQILRILTYVAFFMLYAYQIFMLPFSLSKDMLPYAGSFKFR